MSGTQGCVVACFFHAVREAGNQPHGTSTAVRFFVSSSCLDNIRAVTSFSVSLSLMVGTKHTLPRFALRSLEVYYVKYVGKTPLCPPVRWAGKESEFEPLYFSFRSSWGRK